MVILYFVNEPALFVFLMLDTGCFVADWLWQDLYYVGPVRPNPFRRSIRTQEYGGAGARHDSTSSGNDIPREGKNLAESTRRDGSNYSMVHEQSLQMPGTPNVSHWGTSVRPYARVALR
jgi:hypothetical protein